MCLNLPKNKKTLTIIYNNTGTELKTQDKVYKSPVTVRDSTKIINNIITLEHVVIPTEAAGIKWAVNIVPINWTISLNAKNETTTNIVLANIADMSSDWFKTLSHGIYIFDIAKIKNRKRTIIPNII